MLKRSLKSNAIPKRVIRKPASAGMSRSRALAIYRRQVQTMARKGAPALISQRTVTIGTDGSWFNATVIPRDPAWVAVRNARYVWFSGDPSAEHAVVSTRFTLSRRRRILAGTLVLSVDNYAVVVINGRPVLYDAPTNDPSNFNRVRRINIRSALRRGLNNIVIIAFNFGGPRSQANPAGVAARLEIRQSSLQ